MALGVLHTLARSLLCMSRAFLQFEKVYPVFFLSAASADFSDAKQLEVVWKNRDKLRAIS